MELDTGSTSVARSCSSVRLVPICKPVLLLISASADISDPRGTSKLYCVAEGCSRASSRELHASTMAASIHLVRAPHTLTDGLFRFQSQDLPRLVFLEDNIFLCSDPLHEAFRFVDIEHEIARLLVGKRGIVDANLHDVTSIELFGDFTVGLTSDQQLAMDPLQLPVRGDWVHLESTDSPQLSVCHVKLFIDCDVRCVPTHSCVDASTGHRDLALGHDRSDFVVDRDTELCSNRGYIDRGRSHNEPPFRILLDFEHRLPRIQINDAPIFHELDFKFSACIHVNLAAVEEIQVLRFARPGLNQLVRREYVRCRSADVLRANDTERQDSDRRRHQRNLPWTWFESAPPPARLVLGSIRRLVTL